MKREAEFNRIEVVDMLQYVRTKVAVIDAALQGVHAQSGRDSEAQPAITGMCALCDEVMQALESVCAAIHPPMSESIGA